jgi:hypothetical protein
MTTRPDRGTWKRAFLSATLCAVAISAATLSAHRIKGLYHEGLVKAFVSSPSTGSDAPIPIAWGTTASGQTGLRVACFFVSNSSAPRADAPDWPRITGVGFELPGVRSGFTLLSPLDQGWDLVEDVHVNLPGHGALTLDFALLAPVNPVGHSIRGSHRLLGLAPGGVDAPQNGTRFCLSGPFPDKPGTTPPAPYTIEELINGVVVRFHRVEGHGPSLDVGIWDNAARTIPLYP